MMRTAARKTATMMLKMKTAMMTKTSKMKTAAMTKMPKTKTAMMKTAKIRKNAVDAASAKAVVTAIFAVVPEK